MGGLAGERGQAGGSLQEGSSAGPSKTGAGSAQSSPHFKHGPGPLHP